MTLLQTELLAELATAFPDEIAWRNVVDSSEQTLVRSHLSSKKIKKRILNQGVKKNNRINIQIKKEEKY